MKAEKPSNGPVKEKSVDAIEKTSSLTAGVEKFVEEFLQKASAIIISEVRNNCFVVVNQSITELCLLYVVHIY